MCRKEAGLTDELASILTELTTLNNAENAKVALRARQVCSDTGSLIFKKLIPPGILIL